MANNYLEFSFSAEIDENTYHDFEEMLDALSYDSDKDLPLWYKDHENITSKEDMEEMYSGGLEYSYRDNVLYVWNEGEGDLEIAIEALRAAMGHNNVTKPAVIEYACTCSKPRTGEFGGGVCVVGPWMREDETTYNLGMNMCNKMLQEINSTMSSNPSQ